MIYWFVDPWEPLFMDLDIPNYFKKHKNNYGHIFENMIYVNLKFPDVHFLTVPQKTGAEKSWRYVWRILEILNM